MDNCPPQNVIEGVQGIKASCVSRLEAGRKGGEINAE